MTIQEMLAFLNQEQTIAVTQTITKNTLLFASPGSGKTRVLQTRYLYLVKQNNIDVRNIIAFTFTNKAANELKERIGSELTKDQLDSAWIGTFHSLCIKMMYAYNKTLGIAKFTICDEDDSRRVVKDICESINLVADKKRIDKIHNQIGKYKDDLITPAAAVMLARNDSERETVMVYDKYQSYLESHDLVDFDDIIINILNALKTNQVFKNIIHNKFKYIMIDEVQDTSQAQHAFIKELTGPNNVFMVGDIDQSLYSWRGAKPQYFNNFTQDYSNSQVLELSTNYRSTKTIIDAADAVIKHNKLHYPKKMSTPNPTGDKILVTGLKYPQKEANFVASAILKLHNTYKIPWEDIIILYRVNSQSRIFEDYMKKYKIPYEIIGGLSFYDRTEIKDLIAYVRILVNPDDDLAMKRILALQPGIGSTTISKMSMDATKNNSSIFRMAQNNNYKFSHKSDIALFLQRFKILYDDLTDPLNNYDIHTVISELIDREYKSLIKSKTIEEHQSRLDNIDEFIKIAIEYEVTVVNPMLSDFIMQFALHSDQDDVQENKSTIKFMTGHSVKGLEFKYVFMINAEEGYMPHERSMGDADQIEEERRIFFVMMTRAKEKLFITYSTNRQDSKSNWQRPSVSRFVNEIPLQCKKSQLLP